MAKKISVAMLVIIPALVGGSLSAQEDGGSGKKWYNSYAPGIEGGNMLVNVGVGFGDADSWDILVPPLNASVEWMIKKIPLSIGPFAGLAVYRLSGYSYTKFAVGAKASYHFNFVKNLDPYASLTLGWLTAFGKYAPDINLPLHWGVMVGARYFFTNTVGVYLELGYSELTFGSIGLALKF